MKQNDIALLILLVFISVVASFFIGNKIISPSQASSQKVEVVEKINSEFPQPDPTVFNSDALNPTREIRIGTGNSTQPIQSE